MLPEYPRSAVKRTRPQLTTALAGRLQAVELAAVFTGVKSACAGNRRAFGVPARSGTAHYSRIGRDGFRPIGRNVRCGGCQTFPGGPQALDRESVRGDAPKGEPFWTLGVCGVCGGN